MAAPPIAAENDEGRLKASDSMPEWLACDLGACKVLEDVSAQIVTTCRTFGAQLEGVCGKAVEQLPRGGGVDGSAVDCAEECLSFLTAFGLLSSALLCVAGDLESTVTRPLQKTIATLQEESTGRLKHWQQVRGRFSELQERYGRSRQKSMEAKGKLAHSGSEGSRGFFWRKSGGSNAANDQLAAMSDLARCEEELLRSESSLRELEAESRRRLGQLEQEKRVLLRSALTKGASSLRRFLPLADKAPPPDECGKLPAPEEWSSVLPPSGTPAAPMTFSGFGKHSAQGELSPLVANAAAAVEAATAAAEAAATSTAASDPSLEVAVAGMGPEQHPPSSSPAVKAPTSALAVAAAEAVEAAEAKGAAETSGRPNQEDEQRDAQKDPAAKYAQSGGPSDVGFELAELAEVDRAANSEESEPEDAAVRAMNWSPQVKKTAHAQPPLRKQRSLVFQSSGSMHLLKSESTSSSGTGGGNTGVAATLPTASRREQKIPTGMAPSPMGSPGSDVSSKNSAVAGSTPFTLNRLSTFHVDESVGTTGIATLTGNSTGVVASSGRSAEEAERQEWREVKLGSAPKMPSSGVEASSSSHSQQQNRNKSEDSDDDDLADSSTSRKMPVVLLEEPDIDFGLSPLVAEDPRKAFEKYVGRLPEQLAGTTESSWERLQTRANEHLLGGHVGKLEFFWLHRPGVEATPEASDGLVCFQFVQSCASNFARILHLSVATATEAEPWQDMLPSAVLEVRRLIFGTLPVDSLRAVVLAGEDDTGRIYVDGDVEVSYERCRFRWFQLTQSVRRTRRSATLGLQKKKKLESRFLVLHTHRHASDPQAPRSTIGRLPSLLLRDSPAASSPGASPAAEAPEEAQGGFTSF
mmetsp:Transcript_42086/g.105891  ORF Transcript_42086/g.105891 Transcript_42086/m.105891 type:complete len:865 (+) Transcript_42086:167-2761(+)